MTAWTIPSYAEWAVPGYTEERLLGHGVSGRVVEAVNDATGRRVAIKYLDANLVRDAEFLDQFRASAEQLISLDAAHLVGLFDVVEQPGQGVAIVTELVDGVSLREMMARRGPLAAVAALVVLKDSLLGLAAAHSRRVSHRDVKPENVLIDASGWCKLTDCGLAVRTDRQLPAAGAPAYMAPDLWNGRPNVPATDIYAATAVLYESVTGKPPFSGRPGQLRHQHESVSPALDQVDEPLRDLIALGLAKNPADRPPAARSFVIELDARAAAAYGPDWEDQGRRELAERAAALLPLMAGGGGGSAAATRRARRKVLAFVSIGTAVVVALVAGGAVALSRLSDNVQLSGSATAPFSAQVTVTPPVAASKCTTATTFTYSGTVSATQPGKLSYRWRYSSGKQGPVQTVSFTAPGHQQVSGGAVKTSKAGGGWAEIKVISPVASTSNKAAYKLLCGTANGEIALSASVLPAAQTVSSCAAAAPSLTAAGSITSKKAGTVSYYWALGNGQNSAAGTLTFTGPGTKTVAPLTITPSALPSTGEAVLVVTKPVAATSSPAPYTVSCTTAATATASASAHATSSASSRSSAKASASPSKTTASPTATATTASPTPTATTPTPTPTTTSPTPTPTTSSPTPTPTTSSPTPTPTTSSPTPTASSATGTATALSCSATLSRGGRARGRKLRVAMGIRDMARLASRAVPGGFR
jgi:eukaryotic-like serine/threonine-protein kinase